jgi:hypothetical protein
VHVAGLTRQREAFTGTYLAVTALNDETMISLNEASWRLPVKLACTPSSRLARVIFPLVHLRGPIDGIDSYGTTRSVRSADVGVSAVAVA